jgi:hypothetical protein
MNPKKNKFPMFAGLISAALLTLTACTTTRQEPRIGPDGSTNFVPVKAPDPVKTERVKTVAETISTMALRRALDRFPKDAEEIAKYARAVGGVFCQMHATKKFSPDALETGIAELVLPELKDAETRGYVLDARDVLKATYRAFYADRFSAELPPDEWPAVVAEIFCKSIDQGLKDSGRPGVASRPPAPSAAAAPVWLLVDGKAVEAKDAQDSLLREALRAELAK